MNRTDVGILLVEDNPADVELTVRALKEERIGNHIEVCLDGEEALDYLFAKGRFAGRDTNHRPRLVLLDLKLPKVDGLEVLRAIRADPRTRALPVVVMTSSREEKDLVESYRLGVNAYIQKPVDFEQFRETVKRTGLFWLVVNQPPPNAAFPTS